MILGHMQMFLQNKEEENNVCNLVIKSDIIKSKDLDFASRKNEELKVI